MSFWDSLDPRYTTILCDIWGVVHDGVCLYPNAAERLARWRGQGRRVILITNAPRTAEAVAAQLDRIGLPRTGWHAISTSGEAGITALSALPAQPGFLGTRGDLAVLEGKGLHFVEKGFHDVAVTGLDDHRETVAGYAEQLEGWAADKVRFHCLNPDRMVVRGGVTEPCAGALADAYLALGGEVVWYGKPYPDIYAHALQAAGNPPRDTVLCIGDSLQTDMLGAAREGLDAVFVQGGIHAGEAFPGDFGQQHDLDGWQPVALVAGLA